MSDLARERDDLLSNEFTAQPRAAASFSGRSRLTRSSRVISRRRRKRSRHASVASPPRAPPAVSVNARRRPSRCARYVYSSAHTTGHRNVPVTPIVVAFHETCVARLLASAAPRTTGAFATRPNAAGGPSSASWMSRPDRSLSDGSESRGVRRVPEMPTWSRSPSCTATATASSRYAGPDISPPEGDVADASAGRSWFRRGTNERSCRSSRRSRARRPDRVGQPRRVSRG